MAEPVGAAAATPIPKSVGLRCHRCSQFIGEADGPVELIALVKASDLIEVVRDPRITLRCRCGWWNIFKRPLAQSSAA